MLQSKKLKKAKTSKETEKLQTILQNPNSTLYGAIAHEYTHNVCKRYFLLKYFIYHEAMRVLRLQRQFYNQRREDSEDEMPMPSYVILTQETSEAVSQEQHKICFHLNNLFGGTAEIQGDHPLKPSPQKSKSPETTKKQKT